jgi:CUB/sushi domain-containing protein
VKELRDMASLPTDEHSFILDSFQEFEALARRALHEGETVEDFNVILI